MYANLMEGLVFLTDVTLVLVLGFLAFVILCLAANAIMLPLYSLFKWLTGR